MPARSSDSTSFVVPGRSATSFTIAIQVRAATSERISSKASEQGVFLDARDARSVIGDKYDDLFIAVRARRGEPAMLSQHETTMLESLLQVPEKTVVKAMLANRIGVDGASAGNNLVEASQG